jgi:hypothetical protein
MKRSGDVDETLIEFGVDGTTADGLITRTLAGMSVSTGDQFFWRIDCWGDAGGDITKASIEISEAAGEGPPLAIAKGRMLSWPVFPPGYILESAPAPEGPYEPVAATPIPERGSYKLVVPNDGTFYRLAPVE